MTRDNTRALPTSVAHRWRAGRMGPWGMALLLVAVAFLFIWPVVMQLMGMFRTAAPGTDGGWSLDVIARIYGSPATYRYLWNSLVYGLATTLLATAMGASFAFLAAHSNAWARSLLTPVMLLVFAAPNLFYAISWSLLADPGTGLLNLAVRTLTRPDVTLFNAYTWTGLIVVQALKLTGFCYLLLLGPFQGMNRSFEEASLISGAGRFTTLLRVTIPLMAPALFGVVIVGIVFGLGTFDIPQILGALANIDFLSTEIFKSISFEAPPDYARASALSLFVMLALAVLLVVQWRVLKAGRFVTVTGKSNRQNRWDLGGWRYLGTAAILLFTLFALLLPLVQLILTSLQPTIGVYKFSLANYQAVFRDRQTVQAFSTTGLLAVSAGLLAMLLAALLGHVGRHAPRWIERYLDSATLVPIIMPGVSLAVGLLWAYISIPGLRSLYGTFWLALIGVMVAVMPMASRAVRGALAQIARELEEAAAVSGASPLRVLWDIVIRLMSRSFLAGWLVTAIIAAGMLDVPIMLLSSTRPTVSILVYTQLLAGTPTQACALLVLLLVAVMLLAVAAAALIALRNRLARRQVYPPIQTVSPGV